MFEMFARLFGMFNKGIGAVDLGLTAVHHWAEYAERAAKDAVDMAELERQERIAEKRAKKAKRISAEPVAQIK